MSLKHISLSIIEKQISESIGRPVMVTDTFHCIVGVNYNDAGVKKEGKIAYKLHLTQDTQGNYLLAKCGDHVMNMLADNMPCDYKNERLHSIEHSCNCNAIINGETYRFSFSSRPDNGYENDIKKFSSYIRILEAPYGK